MKKTRNNISKDDILRRQPGNRLKQVQPTENSLLTDATILRNNQELQVYKLELEIQNQELLMARELADKNADKYIELYDFAPSGYFTLSKDGRIVELNLKGAVFIGRERQKLINSRFSLFVSLDTRQVFNNFLETIFLTKSTQSCEVIINSKDKKQPVFVYITGRYIKNEDSCQIIMINISERIQAEEDLKYSMIELTTAYKQLAAYTYDNKELKQFAYISSHQLQQPLRTITNFIHILEEDYGALFDQKAQSYLNTIKDSTERMASLITSLSHYSRLGHNMYLQSVDFNELTKEVIIDLDALITASQTIIDVSHMPVMNAYKDEIRQVFQNLITNAVKFQKKGAQPIIRIGSEKIENYWKFSVSDNGIGIPSDQFDNVFRIFQRLHIDESEYPGKGIGLAYCKKIIELHQGEIWIESDVNKGTSFYFTLPSLKL